MPLSMEESCYWHVITYTLHGEKEWARYFEGYKKVDNIIVMIPDGCDENVQPVARWFKGEELAVDKMQTSAVKTHMANSIITGSAAAATAFATGLIKLQYAS
jgi:alkaline phosphatase